MTGRRRHAAPISVRVGLVVGLVVLIAGQSSADTVTFDFAADGLGPEFTSFQDRPFWTITTDSTGLRISKPGRLPASSCPYREREELAVASDRGSWRRGGDLPAPTPRPTTAARPRWNSGSSLAPHEM